MNEPTNTLEYFRDVTTEKLRFLEGKGFRRARHLEETFSTGGTAVLQGQNITFIFSLDIRDACVDAEIVCMDTRSIGKEEIYQGAQNLIEYLVQTAGYRGGAFSQSGLEKHYVDRMMDEWAALIQAFEKHLLGSQIG